jgi:hypothetical protein
LSKKKQFEFNGWKYQEQNGGRIIPSKETPIPEFFVKYYSLTKYNVDALKKSYLFFTHPFTLNDPFDSCRQLVNLKMFSKRQFIKLNFTNWRFAKPKEPLNEKLIEKKISEWYDKNNSEFLDFNLTFFWNIVFKDWGILSLSDIDNNLLMWSYYTNHLGFAIRFKYDLFNDQDVIGPFPINYAESYKTIYPRSVKIERKNLLYITNVKSKYWSHENEWRFLVNRQNMSIPKYNDTSLSLEKRKVNYKLDKINDIIIGYKFFEDNITTSYYGKGKRLYRFDPINNTRDILRLEILDFVIENNIPLKEVEIEEDNTFRLKIVNLKIDCKVKGKEYFMISEYYTPSS